MYLQLNGLLVLLAEEAYWGRTGAVISAADFGLRVPGSRPGWDADRCGIQKSQDFHRKLWTYD